MTALATIPETIQYADLSVGYIANDNAKGALFGPRLSAPCSPVTLTIVNEGLRWAYEGANTSNEDLREMANYVRWLSGPFFTKAQFVISGGSSGGSVVPGNLSTIFPFYITSADFESDGVSYNDPNIVGQNLEIFVDEGPQQFFTSGVTTFSMTATGLIMNFDWFDANTNSYTIRIGKLGTG